MTPRPKLCRRIRSRFGQKYFKPAGKPIRFLKEIALEKEEAEALNLVDFKKTGQIEAAKKMNTSQSTLQRILSNARKKTAEAIIKGKSLKIND